MKSTIRRYVDSEEPRLMATAVRFQNTNMPMCINWIWIEVFTFWICDFVAGMFQSFVDVSM